MNTSTVADVLRLIREIAGSSHSRQEGSYEAILVPVREAMGMDLANVTRVKLDELHRHIRLLYRSRNTLREPRLISLLETHLSAVDRTLNAGPQTQTRSPS